MPHDLRDLARRRGVAAALRSHDAVDDGHADAGKVTEPDAFQDVFSGRMQERKSAAACGAPALPPFQKTTFQ
jgi:hypothetical protein